MVLKTLTDLMDRVYHPIGIVLGIRDSYVMNMAYTFHGTSLSPRQKVTCNMKFTDTLGAISMGERIVIQW